jgi:hypothetical protein
MVWTFDRMEVIHYNKKFYRNLIGWHVSQTTEHVLHSPCPFLLTWLIQYNIFAVYICLVQVLIPTPSTCNIHSVKQIHLNNSSSPIITQRHHALISLHSFPFSTSTTPPCLANLILATCKALCSFLLVPPKGAQVRGSLSSWSSTGRNASPQPSSSQYSPTKTLD